MKILNIAAGKQKPLELPAEEKSSIDNSTFPKVILNIDTSYFDQLSPLQAENKVKEFKLHGKIGEVSEIYLNTDIFQFMERTTLMFDHVVIYRFLEHVSFTQLNYFIYLVSTIIKKDGIVDIIVPNYIKLAQMILREDPYQNRENFEASNILLTTELLNEPSCPHASIWTPLRAKYFWELEGRFKVILKHIDPEFLFDGRDIYMRFFARRI
jgi:hypothetical protein